MHVAVKSWAIAIALLGTACGKVLPPGMRALSATTKHEVTLGVPVGAAVLVDAPKHDPAVPGPETLESGTSLALTVIPRLQYTHQTTDRSTFGLTAGYPLLKGGGILFHGPALEVHAGYATRHRTPCAKFACQRSTVVGGTFGIGAIQAQVGKLGEDGAESGHALTLFAGGSIERIWHFEQGWIALGGEVRVFRGQELELDGTAFELFGVLAVLQFRFTDAVRGLPIIIYR